eukprot:CAMPEP_0173429136 /NCGR_PEP_ID=MMETSP1357-20121228/7927_1 /TAXON_ID=77926 /ORGANISM="Hemiselmis rufescens, Strain PCC563" /LENGTH=50 /DNA_ID=CAMNT_0014393269 /DNA_START=467 /DNA_END=619 /DNA_ORIENTATION=-
MPPPQKGQPPPSTDEGRGKVQLCCCSLHAGVRLARREDGAKAETREGVPK